jgi:DNA-binding GntR family transcriptional regulator
MRQSPKPFHELLGSKTIENVSPMVVGFQKDLLSTKIFGTIRDKIIFLEYPPGMNLSEKDLCKTFKVSRTPLREAIKRLESMKLVTVIPRYGTFVSPIDINEVRCAFEVKIKLEGLAGEMSATRMSTDQLKELHALIEKSDALLKNEGQRYLIEVDSNFHEVIYRSTGNPILQEILENIHCRCARLWNSALSQRVPIPEIMHQLNEIYLSLEDRDCEKAKHLLEDHVRYFIDLIKNQLL